MLSWAADRLDKLSQTVAPPPTDPASRFLYCMQKNDEVTAMGCLAEIDPLHTIVQPTKGTLPLHLACFHGMVRLIRQLMAIPGAAIEVKDAMGNTPLHHACMSSDPDNALLVVRMLVTEYNASVVARNLQGQTPYDVATLNGVRQYLLPLQLQQETQTAIDNGGVGLPPGIDMGGLRINNPAMPPPPVGGMGGPPPMVGLPPTPPNGGPPSHMWSTPSPNMPPSSYPAPTSMSPTAPAPTSGNSYHRSASAPSSGNHTHARTGASSAATLIGAKYRPDGFHSSSSDVSLQIFYGHSAHGTPVAVPPPPSSGNNSVGSAPPQVTPAGPNPFAAGMSAFGSTNRYGGSSRSRYPVYDAVTGQVSVVASAGGPYSGQQQQPAPTYTMFQPGQMAYQQQPVPQQQQQQQQQPPAYQQPLEPQMSPAPATPFVSPSPFHPQPQQVYQQQPAYQQQPSPYQQPQQPNAYQQPQQPNGYRQPNAYQQQQPPQQAANQAPAWAAPQQQQQQEANAEQMFPPPIPAPYPVSQSTSIAASTGNVSTSSAEELFASPSPAAKQEKIPDLPTAEPVTRTVTEDNARELFATSAGENVSEQQTIADVVATSEVVATASEPTAASAVETFAAPTCATYPPDSVGATGNAADFFGSALHKVESKPPAAAAVASNEGEPEKVQEMQRVLSSVDGMDEVGLDDVPLEEVPITPPVEVTANVAATMNNPSTATGAGVFSSIGLPPPPFSSRQ